MEAKDSEEKACFDGGGAGAKDEGSGSKEGDGRDEAPTIRVLRIEVDEGPSPLTDGLELDVEFITDAPLAAAHWEIKYLVDSVFARHIIRACRRRRPPPLLLLLLRAAVAAPADCARSLTVSCPPPCSPRMQDLGVTKKEDYNEGENAFSFEVRTRFRPPALTCKPTCQRTFLPCLRLRR